MKTESVALTVGGWLAEKPCVCVCVCDRARGLLFCIILLQYGGGERRGGVASGLKWAAPRR